ncbi:MAG TPA: hypothetical protein VFD43_06530, partial [Planctomycetota bacterium]|nr:hypothetical protein [Planctomycetota bacterium]
MSARPAWLDPAQVPGRLAAAAVALLAVCSLAPAGPGDTVVLLAARSLADSERAAALLDGLAAETGILGPARFEILAAPQASPRDFARLLDGRRAERAGAEGGLRAVIAVLGDLSVLQGVDPSIPDRKPDALTSRVVEQQELDAAVEALARAAARQGARLVLASAPLGR